MSAVIRAVVQASITVGVIAVTFALTVLRVFWFAPLAILGAMFGPTMRSILGGIVSPATKTGGGKGKSGNDEQQG